MYCTAVSLESCVCRLGSRSKYTRLNDKPCACKNAKYTAKTSALVASARGVHTAPPPTRPTAAAMHTSNAHMNSLLDQCALSYMEEAGPTDANVNALAARRLAKGLVRVQPANNAADQAHSHAQ